MVALCLQLFAGKLRKLLDGVEIVIGIAQKRIGEFARIELFQYGAVFFRDAAQRERLAVLGGICADCFKRRLGIACADGVEIAKLPVPLRGRADEIAHAGNAAAAGHPKHQICERILAAHASGRI